MPSPVAACTCGEPFDDSADASNHATYQCDGELVFTAEEIERVSAVTMTENPEVSIIDFAQLGSYEYATTVRVDDGDEKNVVVDLFRGEIDALGPNANGLGNEEQRALLAEMISAVPETFENPVTFIRNDHQVVTGDGNGGSAGSSSADDSGGFDGDILSDPGETEYDAEELEDKVHQWLSNYASVKSSMLDGDWNTEFHEITDPEDGSSELGVYINLDPWHGSRWDNDAGQFDTEDGKQPQEWADHKEAMKNVFRDDDSPTEFVVEEGDEYDNWYNYVPADKVSDL